jgi:hypothetical protein
METRTAICRFTIVVTEIAMPTGLPVHIRCHSIVGGRFSTTSAGHSCGVVFVTAGAGGPAPALGCNVQAQQNIGSALLFFNVVIVIYGHMVMSANVRAETKLGKRRANRLRRNMFLRSSLRFPNFFPNFFQRLFPNFFKEFGKIGFGKKFGKKWFSPEHGNVCRYQSGESNRSQVALSVQHRVKTVRQELTLQRLADLQSTIHMVIFCRFRLKITGTP